MVALNSRTSSSLGSLTLAANFLRNRAILSVGKPCFSNSASDALAFVKKSITAPWDGCQYGLAEAA